MTAAFAMKSGMAARARSTSNPMDTQQAAALSPQAVRVAPAASPGSYAAAGEVPGARSLKEVVESAIAEAEARAIRRALMLARGNKSHAARLLRTNYTTLHAKMKRFAISAKDFRPA